MTKNRLAKFCILTAGILTLPAVGFAGTDDKDSKDKKIVEKAKESCITGDLGVNFVTQYVSRGLVLENQGVIGQPYLDLYFKLYEGTGFVDKIQFNLGLWSSVHSHHQPTVTGAASTTNGWYEFDYTPGLAITFAKKFTATISYFEFDSPADNFITARSLNMNLAYDDGDLLGAFALHPHFTVLRELEGAAGLLPGGWYYELGIAPGFAAGPVAVSFPVNVGLGDKRFYSGDTFGYVSVGAQLSVPLSFVPECYGKWALTGGYTFYHLGTAVANATAGGVQSQHVFQGGIGLTF